MFRIEMLPAQNGDCLWLEYGDADEVHRILIDAGTRHSYEFLRNRILMLPKDQRVIDLLIVTHIDNDHIEGVIPLLQDVELGCRFNDIWYNGWRHLADLDDAPKPDDVLGVREGEFVGVLLEDLDLSWNSATHGGRLMVPDSGELPTFDIAGMRLTLLSPTRPRLIALRTEWERVARDARFAPGDVDAVRTQLAERKYLRVPADQLGVEDGPPGRDNSEANASSIAVLAEYGEVRMLLTGDAVPDVLVGSLQRLGCTPARPLAVDVVKLPHHGSWQNLTPELLRLIRTPNYLISTNGAHHHHPHAKAIDLILEHHSHRRRPHLVFNHRCATTEQWAVSAGDGRYQATFPAGAELVL